MEFLVAKCGRGGVLWQVRGGCGARLGRVWRCNTLMGRQKLIMVRHGARWRRRRYMWQGQLGLPIRRSGLVLLDLRGAGQGRVARQRRCADGERIKRYGKLHRAWLHAGHWTITLWKKVVVRLGVRPCNGMGNEAILG